MSKIVKITAEGEAASGKSTILSIIKKALKRENYNVTNIDENELSVERNSDWDNPNW